MTEQIEKRVDKVEERMLTIERTIGDLRADVSIFGTIAKETAKVLEKLNSTLDQVQLSMIKLQGEVGANTQEILEFKGELKDVKENAKKESDKSKLDIVQMLKDHAIEIVLLVYIILQHMGIIKF